VYIFNNKRVFGKRIVAIMGDEEIKNNVSIEVNENTILAHLSFLQQNISRMAGNSANCKSICIAIIAALCSISGLTGYILFAASFVSIIIFCYLDITYLSLEKSYRDMYNNIISVAKYKILPCELLFDMNPGNYDCLCKKFKSFKSWSVWPVYIALCILIIIVSTKK
jgi:hypothetical protein